MAHTRTSKKGISPVIATVILVAVAITVSISVAYWMGGISSLYTRLEKVEISSVAVSKDASGNYNITMALRNTGSADATIDSCFINGKSYDDSSFSANPVSIKESGGTFYTSGALAISLPAGSAKTVIIKIAKNSGYVAPFSVGTTLDLKIHTAAGKDYPQMVTLT